MNALSISFNRQNILRRYYCFLWLLLFLSARSLHAQEENSNSKTSHGERKNIIKITPFKSLDFTNPSFEISYERKTSSKFSTQIMVSKLLSIDLYGSGSKNIEGYRFSLEERFYIDKNSPNREYLAFEFNYLQNSYNNEIQFEDSSANQNDYLIYFEDVLIKKRLYNFNLKMGYQYLLGNLVLDVFFGLGVRYRDVAHYNRSNYKDIMLGPRHPNIHHYKNLPGKSIGLSLPLNLRIGYRF